MTIVVVTILALLLVFLGGDDLSGTGGWSGSKVSRVLVREFMSEREGRCTLVGRGMNLW